MRYTGPEHAAIAEELLLGERRWPSRIPDRMAAAQAHATLALTSAMAMAFVEGQVDDAVLAEWASSLPVPDVTAAADVVAAAWVEEQQEGGR